VCAQWLPGLGFGSWEGWLWPHAVGLKVVWVVYSFVPVFVPRCASVRGCFGHECEVGEVCVHVLCGEAYGRVYGWIFLHVVAEVVGESFVVGGVEAEGVG